MVIAVWNFLRMLILITWSDSLKKMWGLCLDQKPMTREGVGGGVVFAHWVYTELLATNCDYT